MTDSNVKFYRKHIAPQCAGARSRILFSRSDSPVTHPRHCLLRLASDDFDGSEQKTRPRRQALRRAKALRASHQQPSIRRGIRDRNLDDSTHKMSTSDKKLLVVKIARWN
jgi:hypothetical protein